jgi:xanthine dehydrogenase accessory factor
MSDLAATLRQWRAEGERIAMATVVKVSGSAPRSEGAKMLVSGRSRIAGSVSGGCVEGAVAEEARDVLESGIPKIVRYGINRNMMWDVGLSCGGAIDVFIESLEGQDPALDEPGAVSCTIVSGPDRLGERIVFHRDSGNGAAASSAGIGELAKIAGEARESGTAALHEVGPYQVFVDPQVPPSRALIVGAVHIAVLLCEAASKAGFAVTVIDPRERLNNRERFPDATALIVGWPEDALPKLTFDENTYVVVLTHDEKFDEPTLDHVLRRDVRYVGAIGSKKTQALRRQRLIDSGIAIEAIDKLHAPIGLDIGAQTPEEIAISIIAEMIAAKYGHRGSRLREREAPSIHT